MLNAMSSHQNPCSHTQTQEVGESQHGSVTQSFGSKMLIFQRVWNQVWWHTPLILAFGKKRQVDPL